MGCVPRQRLFDGVSAKVFETPGHHPSCLTFEVGGLSGYRRCLYSGRGCGDAFAGGGEEFGGAVGGADQIVGGREDCLPGARSWRRGVMIIDSAVLDDLTVWAKASLCLRMNLNLRNFLEDVLAL